MVFIQVAPWHERRGKVSLQDQIRTIKEEFLRHAPEETARIMREANERLIRADILKNALKEGDRMPAFSLPNARGQNVTSRDLLEQGPLVINFYRGGWCPYCNLELNAYQKIVPEIERLGARLVAISPNLPDKSLSTVEKNSLTFEVLSDLKNKAARDFGLVFTLPEELRGLYTRFGIDIPGDNGDESYELPVPATYVVDAHQTIVLAFCEVDYTMRLEPAEVTKALRQIRS